MDVRRIGALLAVAALAGGCSKKEGGPRLGVPEAGAQDAGHDAGVADDATSFPDTGIGSRTLLIERIVPDHGPFTGGTRAVVRGNGFTADAVVTVGGRMVQPADTDLIDRNRLAIVVPAGEPGPADVSVVVDGVTATLPGGWTYDALAVDPDRGAVSGGTFVTLTGSGTAFAAGDRVFFGRSPCTDVTVVSETTITCRTPPMAAGTVDVKVVRAADGSEIVAEDAFTYFDSSDPFGGGLGGGPIRGSIHVTVLNAASGDPVPDAYVVVGEDLRTPYQGLTDLRGQITFSGPDLGGRQTIHVAKFCFEKTSVVAFDARDVTVFLVPWMDPMCGMGGMPPTGRGRQGARIEGELIWLGPNEYGPNPWANIPDPREDEEKVAYVYTTQYSVDLPNPDPSLGGARQRVTEVLPPVEERRLGYPYSIFARPAGLAVYALAGLENRRTGEFIPYVMGVARNVLAGPGETVRNVNIVMDIPLDHRLDVELSGLPSPGRTGPDRFRVSAFIDLGGEGVIVRYANPGAMAGGLDPLDVVRARTASRPFRFWAQPALHGALADGRYRVQAGWFTGDFDAQPYTWVLRTGVRDVSEPVRMEGFLGVPRATSPAYGERLPTDRVLRWSADGPPADLHVVVMVGGDGNPAWRHFTPGDVFEAPIPDLSSIPEITDISRGFLTWAVFRIKIPGFTFDTFSYAHLNDRYWSHAAVDFFVASF
ncbi:MAG: IPT/TIG domain-containing protein [Myxococcota bacterium]|nr:IPT/TIG domain-containing protein [Myxococcota bacterium]MDW8361643.1 IPT/TIG domain-containing protein [Myxococcales bacterium]